jgi:hypothetical protein
VDVAHLFREAEYIVKLGVRKLAGCDNVLPAQAFADGR